MKLLKQFKLFRIPTMGKYKYNREKKITETIIIENERNVNTNQTFLKSLT